MVFAVRLAEFVGISDISVEVCADKVVGVAGASAQYFDAVTGQHVQRSAAHIARKHYANAHSLQYRGDVALAAAALRRGQRFFRYDGFAVGAVDGVAFTMSEMVVYRVPACGYCYFHGYEGLYFPKVSHNSLPLFSRERKIGNCTYRPQIYLGSSEGPS